MEADIRSWDLSVPEEINRMVTDTLPANVDEVSKFKALLQAISESSRSVPVIFPVHPRTRKIIDDLYKDNSLILKDSSETLNIHLVEPLGYHEFNYLVENAKAVITDSGGITEETTVLGVPCITLRNNTERPETITIGTNELIGTDPTNIKPALDKLFSGQWKKGGIPELWDGGAAERIVGALASQCDKDF